MTIISSKSASILSNMEIPLYKKRKSLGQNQAIEVTLHKRDDVVAILPIPFKEIPEDQKQLFLSIMKTITSQNPIIEEVSLDLGSKNMQLSYFFEKPLLQSKGLDGHLVMLRHPWLQVLNQSHLILFDSL